MEKCNVLVIGNSGVGKSTLINAVLGENKAKTNWGTKGTTTRLEIYESNEKNVPFRMIDTIGFEPNLKKRFEAIHAVKKWTKENMDDEEKRQIDMIWFCVDGTRSKLFVEDIKQMLNATNMWKSVPMIAVITKSYSQPDRSTNIKMVEKAFSKVKKRQDNLCEIIPVVADVFRLNDTAFAPPEGIDELINLTNKLLPEGRKAAEKDLEDFVLKRKRFFAQSVVTTSTAAATVVGAVPIPFSDAALLVPIETAELNALARIYGVKKDEKNKPVFESMIEAGTVSLAAKTLISGLKVIPGVNIAASVLNAVVAGTIAALLGEGTVCVFEQVFTGKKSIEDVEWIRRVIEEKMTSTVIEKAKPILEKLNDESTKEEILRVCLELAKNIFGQGNDKELHE